MEALHFTAVERGFRVAEGEKMLQVGTGGGTQVGCGGRTSANETNQRHRGVLTERTMAGSEEIMRGLVMQRQLQLLLLLRDRLPVAPFVGRHSTPNHLYGIATVESGRSPSQPTLNRDHLPFGNP